MFDKKPSRVYRPSDRQEQDILAETSDAHVTSDEEVDTIETAAVSAHSPSGYGSLAYEILHLQERLVAYERLHQEEMAELRKEIERLRREFLRETNPDLQAITLPKPSQPQE
jgi:hypothetical protein